jgi:hypothetical protein
VAKKGDWTFPAVIFQGMEGPQSPGQLIRVDVIGNLPKAFAGQPTIGDVLP